MEHVICDSVVKILDIFDDSFLVYVVMEYMGGGDLRSRIIQNGPFSGYIVRWGSLIECSAASVIQQIGNALVALHQQKIYHLDVKPENIIFESNDQKSKMKLTDFGCSMIAEVGNQHTK